MPKKRTVFPTYLPFRPGEDLHQKILKEAVRLRISASEVVRQCCRKALVTAATSTTAQ